MDNTSGKGFLPLFCSCLQEIPDKLPQFDVSSLCPPVAYDACALCLAFSSECSWIPREQWAKVLDDGCSLEAYANFSGFMVMVVEILEMLTHTQITVIKGFLEQFWKLLMRALWKPEVLLDETFSLYVRNNHDKHQNSCPCCGIALASLISKAFVFTVLLNCDPNRRLF